MIDLAGLLTNPFYVFCIVMGSITTICIIWGFLVKKQEESLLQEKKYKLYHNCKNCHEQRVCIIPIGTTLNDFLKDKKCGKCGCDLISGEMS